MEQLSNVGSQLRDKLDDVSYYFFSLSPVRQLFNRDTTAIFVVAPMGMYQPGPWPGLRVWGGQNTYLRAKGFCVCYLSKTNCNMTNASMEVPQYNLFCKNEVNSLAMWQCAVVFQVGMTLKLKPSICKIRLFCRA